MGDTVKERVIEFVNYKGIKMKTFESKCGLSSGYVTSMRKGFGAEKLNNVLNAYPELNREWLLYGEGEMLRSQEGNVPFRSDFKEERGVMVPLINIDSVGGVHSHNQLAYSEQYVIERVPFPNVRPGDVAILQSGDSMAPTIPAGSILQIRKVEDWREYFGYGNVYVLLLKDGRRITKLVKRFDEDPRNYVLCCSYNPDAADEELPRNFIAEVWKVINVLMNKGW
ncbi:MAG: S24 family peptidase [Muribaculaceae bacterium]|nr:S24 family peptidase [Muribaculaceae bacterium]